MTYVPPSIVPPTQAQIDSAVLKVKGMFYHLSWELVKEEQYGGNIECCKEKAKLFYLWRRSLSCQVKEVLGVGSFQILSLSGPPQTRHLEIFVDNVSISGFMQTNVNSVATWLTFIVTNVNAYQSVYVASTNGTDTITITGSGNHHMELKFSASIVIDTNTDITGAIAPQGCLTDAEIFDLIGKINTEC